MEEKLLDWVRDPDFSERLEAYVAARTLDECMSHYRFFDAAVKDYLKTDIENLLFLLRNRFREECLRRISDTI